jgi:hypothetical protein
MDLFNSWSTGWKGISTNTWVSVRKRFNWRRLGCPESHQLSEEQVPCGWDLLQIFCRWGWNPPIPEGLSEPNSSQLLATTSNFYLRPLHRARLSRKAFRMARSASVHSEHDPAHCHNQSAAGPTGARTAIIRRKILENRGTKWKAQSKRRAKRRSKQAHVCWSHIGCRKSGIGGV